MKQKTNTNKKSFVRKKSKTKKEKWDKEKNSRCEWKPCLHSAGMTVNLFKEHCDSNYLRSESVIWCRKKLKMSFVICIMKWVLQEEEIVVVNVLKWSWCCCSGVFMTWCLWHGLEKFFFISLEISQFFFHKEISGPVSRMTFWLCNWKTVILEIPITLVFFFFPQKIMNILLSNYYNPHNPTTTFMIPAELQK